MFTRTGRRSGLSQSQHTARPQTNNLLMEKLAPEKIQLAKEKKYALLNQAVGGLIILQVPF